MASLRESSEEEDDELKCLDAEIRELKITRKELYARARPVNVELEKNTRRERECVDRMNRIRSEKHDRERQSQSVRRLIELEAEMKRLHSENDALKRTNASNTVTIERLKESLNESEKNSRLQTRTIAELKELNAKISAVQQSRSANTAAGQERAGYVSRISELQEQLHKTRELLSSTKEKLNETQQRLSDTQERVILTGQVTAATQQRELQESGNMEELRLELTRQHQPASRKGLVYFYYFKSHSTTRAICEMPIFCQQMCENKTLRLSRCIIFPAI